MFPVRVNLRSVFGFCTVLFLFVLLSEFFICFQPLKMFFIHFTTESWRDNGAGQRNQEKRCSTRKHSLTRSDSFATDCVSYIRASARSHQGFEGRPFQASILNSVVRVSVLVLLNWASTRTVCTSSSNWKDQSGAILYFSINKSLVQTSRTDHARVETVGTVWLQAPSLLVPNLKMWIIIKTSQIYSMWFYSYLTAGGRSFISN